ncbi:YqjD family protein [Glaciimonas sp. PCH181]|uniref:DUF883 family protein n=1 Tax=Glaciimonas sp. PCH181 TaxID=2133943 RepID=UPI000D39F9D3|nr:DUF883 family protein [Glaciimonas sp. PCH181]PUA16995.1 DUF883 domain-containing protein [Glaciimonas sp. PCH181]
MMRNTALKNARRDMQALVREAQLTFREASNETGEKANALISKGIGLLDDTLTKAQQVQSAAIDSGREMVTTTDEFVHENPWRAIAVSLGIGLLAGICISRK